MRLEDVDSDDDLGAALRLSDGELQRVGVYDALDAVASPGIGAETLRSRLDAAGEPELVSDDLAHLMAQHEGAISVRLPRELNTLDQGLAALPDSRSSDEPFGERWLQIGRDTGGGRLVMDSPGGSRVAIAPDPVVGPLSGGCLRSVLALRRLLRDTQHGADPRPSLVSRAGARSARLLVMVSTIQSGTWVAPRPRGSQRFPGRHRRRPPRAARQSPAVVAGPMNEVAAGSSVWDALE